MFRGAVILRALAMKAARRIHIRGVVQGVGFRPFVYRVAMRRQLAGWVQNGEGGVEIHIEGRVDEVEAFIHEVTAHPPGLARITEWTAQVVPAEGWRDFRIAVSARRERPTAQIPADLPVCAACLAELFNPADRRYLYPYINCSECGPRYSVIERLPYDRPHTTMRAWPMCPDCAEEYHAPDNRRFHAQPIACPACGPRLILRWAGGEVRDPEQVLAHTAVLLREGQIVAIKGLGGYHLACDADNEAAVRALRARKHREAKPFALMAADLATARTLVALGAEEEALLTSPARPIVVAPALQQLNGVAPGNHDLGVMLPYTPLQHLLFHLGAPSVLVMTSANRSEEPIVYADDEALQRLAGIADAWLLGERPIARRVDDSVCHVTAFGAAVLRRARGLAPLPVAALPSKRPILAVGSDLKSSVTLVIAGQAIMSQHLGDLTHYEAYTAFEQTVQDLLAMYEVPLAETLVVHDLHPDQRATHFAGSLEALQHLGVQHHRAHAASVLAERGAWERRVVAIVCDGTGLGDDGAIWGGELFVGSVAEGFQRHGHLRYAALPGGDAAARFPLQALAGFCGHDPAWAAAAAQRLGLPERFFTALKLVEKGVRIFPTTSVGRLFDAAAALAGFTGGITFEGQAAIWLEHLARTAPDAPVYPLPWDGRELDDRPLLEAFWNDRLRGRDPAYMARAFHRGVAAGLSASALALAETHGCDTVVLSGGVFQNAVLLAEMSRLLTPSRVTVWVNRAVPPNDGGVSLGQAALALYA